jgi:LysM repeat protein
VTAIEMMSVRRTVQPVSPRESRTKSVAMTIAPESGGTVLNIPYAPKEVDHSNLVVDYVTVPRPALLENVVYSNPMRPRMSFELKIHDKRVTATSGGVTTLQKAVSVILAIQSMGRTGKRVRIAYGALESGLWYLTDMKVKSTRRDPLTDEITSAEVSLDLIRGDSTVANGGTGPVTGGATTTTKPVTTTPKGTATPTKAPAAPAARSYVVKRGDTLWGISLKFYGTGTKWQRIADANKIKDTRKLGVGKKLRIP